MTEKTTGNDEFFEKKQKNDFPDESYQTDSMQPLIIKQAPNNPKGKSHYLIILVQRHIVFTVT